MAVFSVFIIHFTPDKIDILLIFFKLALQDFYSCVFFASREVFTRYTACFFMWFIVYISTFWL